MITEHDLQEAIAECQGKRNPDAKTCMMLAAFLTIRREMFGESEQMTKAQELEEPLRLVSNYSYAPPPEEVGTTIAYSSDTDFGRAINGREASEVWPIIDELVNEPVRAILPRVYEAFMHKLKS